jgi:hypothetical protein
MIELSYYFTVPSKEQRAEPLGRYKQGFVSDKTSEGVNEETHEIITKPLRSIL